MPVLAVLLCAIFVATSSRSYQDISFDDQWNSLQQPILNYAHHNFATFSADNRLWIISGSNVEYNEIKLPTAHLIERPTFLTAPPLNSSFDSNYETGRNSVVYNTVNTTTVFLGCDSSATLSIFDVYSMNFIQTINIPIPVQYCCMVLYDDIVYFIGGQHKESLSSTPYIQMYDIMNELWSMAPNMQFNHSNHGCDIITESEDIYIFDVNMIEIYHISENVSNSDIINMSMFSLNYHMKQCLTANRIPDTNFILLNKFYSVRTQYALFDTINNTFGAILADNLDENRNILDHGGNILIITDKNKTENGIIYRFYNGAKEIYYIKYSTDIQQPTTSIFNTESDSSDNPKTNYVYLFAVCSSIIASLCGILFVFMNILLCKNPFKGIYIYFECLFCWIVCSKFHRKIKCSKFYVYTYSSDAMMASFGDPNPYLKEVLKPMVIVLFLPTPFMIIPSVTNKTPDYYIGWCFLWITLFTFFTFWYAITWRKLTLVWDKTSNDMYLVKEPVINCCYHLIVDLGQLDEFTSHNIHTIEHERRKKKRGKKTWYSYKIYATFRNNGTYYFGEFTEKCGQAKSLLKWCSTEKLKADKLCGMSVELGTKRKTIKNIPTTLSSLTTKIEDNKTNIFDNQTIDNQQKYIYCAVCWGVLLENSKQNGSLICGHTFHTICIQQKRECPLCLHKK